MLNFNDIKYERVDYEQTEKELEKKIKELQTTTDQETYVSIVKSIIDMQNYIEEMSDYADIKNMRDLDDNFYKKEMEYWNAFKSKFDLLFLPFYEEFATSKFKDRLMDLIPPNFFRIIACQKRIISEDNVELLRRENDLKMQYRNLNKTKIHFQGEDRTIAVMGGFCGSSDRNTRKEAHDAVNDFYYAHRDEYSRILIELVNTRNEVAKNLGFTGYVEYSLVKHKRFDYDYVDLAKFRDNVVKFIVPLCQEVNKWQKEELGLEELEYYDTVFFSDTPSLDVNDEDLQKELEKSFKEIDEELGNLFGVMCDDNYIDFASREGKVNFSITNYLTRTHMPIITGNYKSTCRDVQTTSHEMGHAYQKYCAAKEDEKFIISPLLKYPTMEIAEMFSYSMELIVMVHVQNLFTEEDYKKYCFMEMYNLLVNLPYICLVDEFQEKIYSKDDLQVDDLKTIWLSLVKKYHLEKSNCGHINLNTGGFFFRQTHIFLDPFYYIDYGLSYFGAFSIWHDCEKNIELFKELGGLASYYSFKDLIEKYGMPNPFDEQTVKDIAARIKEQLVDKRPNKSENNNANEKNMRLHA